jgi:hypothetical protein
VTGVWHTWGSVILVSLFGLPLAAVLAWVLAASRPDRPARYAFAEVFAAAGFRLPVRWPVGIGAVLLLGAGASTVVEVMQYALDLGRVSSGDDVLLNALGAGLAAAASQPLWRRSRQVNDALVAR